MGAEWYCVIGACLYGLVSLVILIALGKAAKRGDAMPEWEAKPMKMREGRLTLGRGFEIEK